MRRVANVLLAILPFITTGCEGIFDDIYDKVPDIVPADGQIIVDASDWGNWYYIDLPTLARLSQEGDGEALRKAQTEHKAYPIPMTLTGESDGKSGQYLYWFDVWGAGIANNEFRRFTPCDAQPEPAEWSFAIHRNNVRTNGGAVYETSCSSMDELPESSEAFRNAAFVGDEWSENEVWDSQEQMLLCLVPSQGIAVNKVLSSWLTMDIPPVPPAFSMNSHVFVLRLADGSYAALQLADYLSPSGTKCFLTINYRYPY